MTLTISLLPSNQYKKRNFTMEIRTENRIDMLGAVDGFRTEKTADFTPYLIAVANLAQLKTLIAEIRELAAVKTSGAGKQTTVQKAVVIEAMGDKMKHISRTIRALAIDNPGLDRLFSVPDGKNHQKLAAAREFVKEAAKF
jgi:hypothetical protein